MVTTMRSIWNKTFLLGSTVWSNNVSIIYQIPTTPAKASNGVHLLKVCDVIS